MKVLVGWEWSPSYPQGSQRYRAGEVSLLGLGKSKWGGGDRVHRWRVNGWIPRIH